jgi:predicted CXXCH cytochrome family protein
MRHIGSEYEVPDDDDIEGGHWYLRKPPKPWARYALTVAALVLVVGTVVGMLVLSRAEQQDAFCTGCHTLPEQTYLDRATSSVAGALAPDLSSYHYQQIQGAGGTVRCIDCHKGNGGLGHQIDVQILSAGNAIQWLSGRNNTTPEKLRLRVPHLANEACLNCHEKTLLLAGFANHQHNMLPVAYEMWRNGGRLIAPPEAKDKQAVIATGLVKYDATVQCTDCHQAHRTTEADRYLEKQVMVPKACVQCHREAGKGPLEVTVP